MRDPAPPLLRTLSLAVAAVTVMTAVPVPVVGHADHPDDVVHVEHDHPGHGTLLERDDARIPAPHGPALHREAPLHLAGEPAPIPAAPVAEEFLAPTGRAPPPHLPRAPPTTS